MNQIDVLKQEHESIERELFELDTIIQNGEDGGINYSNLIHVLKKLHDIWNNHEIKEEGVFRILKHEKIIVPVKEMLFEHNILKKHKDIIYNAINSGNNEKVKQALEKDLSFIIEELRKHINKEDEILYRIVLEEFSKDDLDKLRV